MQTVVIISLIVLVIAGTILFLLRDKKPGFMRGSKPSDFGGVLTEEQVEQINKLNGCIPNEEKYPFLHPKEEPKPFIDHLKELPKFEPKPEIVEDTADQSPQFNKDFETQKSEAFIAELEAAKNRGDILFATNTQIARVVNSVLEHKKELTVTEDELKFMENFYEGNEDTFTKP